MTPFFCSLAFPLRELDLGRLDGAWEQSRRKVPGAPGRARRPAVGRDDGCDGTRSQAGWRHRTVKRSWGELDLVAAEAVRLDQDLRKTQVQGYLLLHVEAGETARESAAMRELADLARPGTGCVEQVAKELADETDGDVAWKLGDVPRVASIALSGVASSGDPGMVHWKGSTGLDRRLASLLVLRRDEVEVGRPYPLEPARPTPSYVLESSGSATAIIRLRPVAAEHVARLRSVWVDVLLEELVRRDILADLAEDVRCHATGKVTGKVTGRNRWTELGGHFRTWRTAEYLRPETDHPMEQGLARRIRDELRTEELVARIGAEIQAHSAAAALGSSEATNGAVLLLTVVAAWVPVLLQASQFGLRASLDLYFGIAVTASAVVSVLAFLRLRNR